LLLLLRNNKAKDLNRTNFNKILIKMASTEDLINRKSNALSAQRGLSYFIACEELGILRDDVEDPDLHQSGELEFLLYQENITAFIGKADDLIKRSAYDTNKKRELLIYHFPERFSPKGVQPIGDYNDSALNTLFQHVLGSYKTE
jgi:hypothetical protein